MNNAQIINDLIMKCAEYKKDAEYLAGERDYWKQQAQQTDSVPRGYDTDTREKLEADVMNFCERFYTTERRYNELIKLLDRQAAITERECDTASWKANYVHMKDRVHDLQEQVDDLEDKYGELLSEKVESDETCDIFAEKWEAEKKRCAELEAMLKEERKSNFKELVSQDDRIAALEDENAEIKSRHCPHYHVKEHYCDVHETRIAELLAKVDALEAELNRTCTLAYDGKWLTCSECGESLQWFGVRTVYKGDTQERALGVEGVRYCAFCGARIEMDGESE